MQRGATPTHSRPAWCLCALPPARPTTASGSLATRSPARSVTCCSPLWLAISWSWTSLHTTSAGAAAALWTCTARPSTSLSRRCVLGACARMCVHVCVNGSWWSLQVQSVGAVGCLTQVWALLGACRRAKVWGSSHRAHHATASCAPPRHCMALPCPHHRPQAAACMHTCVVMLPVFATACLAPAFSCSLACLVACMLWHAFMHACAHGTATAGAGHGKPSIRSPALPWPA